MTLTVGAQTQQEPETLLDKILWLAREFGCYVLPVDHPDLPKCAGLHGPKNPCDGKRGKHPCVKPSLDATNKAQDIIATFAGVTRNYGVQTRQSRIFGVDEDTASLADYAASIGETVPETFEVNTGRPGGKHKWFRLPAGVELGNSRGKLPKGIDIRAGADGYLVGPGSKHANGTVYTATWDRRPALAPQWLIDALTPDPVDDDQDDDGTDEIPEAAQKLLAADVDKGGRSERFHAIVGACRAGGMSKTATVAALTPWCKKVDKYVGRVAAEVDRCWQKVDGPKASRTSTEAINLPSQKEVENELVALGPDVLGAKKRAREIAKLVAEAVDDPATLLDWRDLLKAFAGLPSGEFNAITKQVTNELKQKREAEAAAERQKIHAEQMADAASQGNMLPSPWNPLAVARELMARQPHTDGRFHQAWWRDDYYQWTGSHWRVETASTIRRWIYRACEHATFDGGEIGIQPWQPDRDKVNKVLDALGTAVIQRYAGADPDKVIACANGVYDLAASRLLPHSPARFNLTSLPYAYDPDATCPQWLAFLNQVLPNDPDVPAEQQGQQFLKEWFGYIISGRTDLQKIASLVGPPRCGKGTIARVLAALIGPESVAAPTVEKMIGPFGEQNFIGKSLAILGDVRWNSRAISAAVPIFLAICGEDARDVARKNRSDWHGKLDVRFTMMSNDTPTFNDASGALGIRMIQLGFTESFAGREDASLTGRLVTEMPGILNWALDGLRALTERGRFVEPASGVEIANEVRRLSSPETAFVEDRCTLVPGYPESIDSLYDAFKTWCHQQGREFPSTKEVFSRNLHSAFRGKVATKREGVPKRTYVVGLRLDGAL